MKSRCAYLHKGFHDGVLLWAEVVSPEGSDSSYCIIRTTAVQLHGERGEKNPNTPTKKQNYQTVNTHAMLSPSLNVLEATQDQGGILEGETREGE